MRAGINVLMVALAIHGSGCSLLFDFDKDAGPSRAADANALADADPCNPSPPCPASMSGFSICGHVTDLPSGRPVRGADAANLSVSVFNAANFAAGNETAVFRVPVDDCGWYQVSEVPAVLTILVTDDTLNTGDVWLRTALAVSGVAGETMDNQTVLALSHTAAAGWLLRAGLPMNPTLAETGANMVIYFDNNTLLPASNVTPTVSLGVLQTACFTDTVTDERLSPSSTALITGANGTCLLDLALQNMGSFSGTGGEPATCTWATVPFFKRSGILLVSLIPSVCP